MNERNRIYTLIATVFFVMIAVFITHSISNQKVDKQSIKEELSDISSYLHESTFIIDQYSKKKVTETYAETQINFINKKVVSLFDEMATTKIPPMYQNDINRIEDISLRFAQQLTSITAGESIAIKNQKSSLGSLDKEIKDLQKKYE